MSRKTMSGADDLIASIASSPFAHSPTISTPESLSSISRIIERASGSSSTTNARIRVASVILGPQGNLSINTFTREGEIHTYQINTAVKSVMAQIAPTKFNGWYDQHRS